MVQKKKQEKGQIDNWIAWLAQQLRSVKVDAVVRRIYSRLYRVSSNISRGARLKFCRRVRSRFFSGGGEGGRNGRGLNAGVPARAPCNSNCDFLQLRMEETRDSPLINVPRIEEKGGKNFWKIFTCASYLFSSSSSSSVYLW